ncbi:hypothetical protein C6P40_001990 [Pichia californica]|uniref:Uncharacterized protein n=1 Tax=Pichia californica TaxID=460514 RepID=A0A9P6WIQ9_9ASCO|nr:hypothetical protein C6P42_004140 [[Candida] californica]KAG0687686.1 hypothetical protein C6P40_001990 [[Candida] californica]
MIIHFALPLHIFKSWIYICISIITIFLILFPTSILIYLHFQSNILPDNAPIMNLQFQYLKDSGPFAFYNMTESALDSIKPWKNSNTNSFTKIEQVLTLHLKYIKLTSGSTVGGIRLSIYDDKNSPILHIKQKNEIKRSSWPFRALSSLNNSENEFSLYRIDRKFNSWKEIIGKSYTKSIPFINDSNNLLKFDDSNNKNNSFSLLDYFIPKWILNIFIPKGLQDLFSIKRINNLLKRKESNLYDNNTKNIKTLDLLNSFGNFKDLPSKTFSTGIILFNGQLSFEDFINTSLLVELDTTDIFIIESYAKLDYVLNGFRWWVYWWPGLCFIIGVLTIWIFSCFGYFMFSWITMFILGVYNWLMEPIVEEINNDEIIKKNLKELLKK